ncbi:NUDIX domain-containing protein [Planktotalea sp.]|uniref:NUDIX domain-containing protein n=1 Tax=Planktotalea sp. TaxID=2029877 RepID=UPI0025DFF400|nr:NUDIX domain-containing protein [Planktotalea sp.]
MSTSLFFYGTLCHIPLLELVLGRTRDEIEISQCELNDHFVSWVKDESFPMIASQSGAILRGLLVQGLNEDDVARLRFYEGGFDYDLSDVRIMTPTGEIPALVFFPEPGLWTAGEPWELSDWIEAWGDVSLSAAREVMEQFGKKSVQDMAQLLPFLRARGWAKHLAKTGAPSSLRRDTSSSAVSLRTRDEGYAGFFRLDTFDVSYPRFDGTQSDTRERAAFVAYDAALVLPYDPARDLVMLIEQMRYGPLLRGDPAPWILEPIAGLVDAGEAPIEAARREAVEEAGLNLSDIRPMLQTYPSPGYSTEFFHCFLGLCDLDPSLEGVHGLASENEDIRTHVVSFERAMELVDNGEINGGPTVMMLLWLARSREDFRPI